MFMSLLILLGMPILDTSRIRGSQFQPLMRFSFWTFVACFFILMFIGSQHVESPYVEIGAAVKKKYEVFFLTAYYFGSFLVVVPVLLKTQRLIKENH